MTTFDSLNRSGFVAGFAAAGPGGRGWRSALRIGRLTQQLVLSRDVPGRVELEYRLRWRYELVLVFFVGVNRWPR